MQKSVSVQLGQAIGVVVVGKMAVHASQIGSCSRLLAVNTLFSLKKISPAAISALAYNPSCLLVVEDVDVPSSSSSFDVEIESTGRSVARTSHFGATLTNSSFKKSNVSEENLSGS